MMDHTTVVPENWDSDQGKVITADGGETETTLLMMDDDEIEEGMEVETLRTDGSRTGSVGEVESVRNFHDGSTDPYAFVRFGDSVKRIRQKHLVPA